MLDEVGALFFDLDAALLEDGVVGALVLLLDRLDRLRLDTGLRWIVDTAGKVAVGVSGPGGADPIGGGEQAGEELHGEFLLGRAKTVNRRGGTPRGAKGNKTPRGRGGGPRFPPRLPGGRWPWLAPPRPGGPAADR